MSRSLALVLAAAAATLGLGAGYSLRSAPQGMEQALSGPPAQAGEVVREILAGDDPLRRADELASLFRELPPEALPQVSEAYAAAALDGGDLELSLFGIWWARFDPDAAVRWTATDWRARYANVSTAVLRSWARRDPQAAYAAAKSKRFPVQRELSIDAVISGWDESGQPGLEALVAKIDDNTDRQRTAEVLARRRVVSLGPEAALAWVEAIDSAEFAALMRPRVASAVAQLHPQIAARWAEPRIASSERMTGLPRRIGTRWVRADPEAAMAWLASLPAGKDRGDGVAESFRDWYRSDPVPALAWIQAQPVEPWNEEAFGVYARSVLGFQDPQQALALAASFSDPTLRDRTTIIVSRSWLERDWDAADAWLQQLELSEGVRKRAYMIRKGPRPLAAAGQKREAANEETDEEPEL